MEQKLKMGFPTQIMCLLPLLNISLSNLSSIRNEVAKMTPDELKIFETLSRGGSGAKAFFDTNLTNVLTEMGAYEIREPDVAVVNRDNSIVFEYNCSTDFETYKPTLVNTDSFIRNPLKVLRDINWVIGTSKKMYNTVLEHQRDYLSTNDSTRLRALSQSDIAPVLEIHYTNVSRLLVGKSLRAIDGTIMSLASLCVSQEHIDKLRVYPIIQDMLVKGEYPSSDDIAVREIYQRTGGEAGGIKLARRTVSKYRTFLVNHATKIKESRIIKNLESEVEHE
ncbi:MAG: hypothetical protein AABX16_01910 [Nanoarchaeota archaeon]